LKIGVLALATLDLELWRPARSPGGGKLLDRNISFTNFPVPLVPDRVWTMKESTAKALTAWYLLFKQYQDRQIQPGKGLGRAR